ncbi:MAG: hypothetical protein KGH56_01765 [Patescibacteria group bacterium]|nr:hypothetical protein [Patescibacteria group bacterium]
MKRFLLILGSLLLPAIACAAPASFTSARAVLSASSSPGNAYAAGASIVLTAPVAGDFSAAGGSIVTAGPIGGDELLIGGSVSSRGRVAGDLRTAGGSITVEGPVKGDLIAFGLSVYDSERPGGSVFIAAANASLTSGAAGPVTVYGNNVFLSGDFGGDVDIVASGRVALAAGTTIRGKLSYEAPEMAIIPASATIVGGTSYTNTSYLPNIGTSHALDLINLGFFLFVRILGALILAGLLAGLFPHLAETIMERASSGRVRDVLLSMLLGFGVLVAGPISIVLLALTFVGIGLAFLLAILYALLMLLAFLYAGILLGILCAWRFSGRETVLWRDGVFGMLALSVVALIPFIGPFVALLFTTFSAGALLLIFFAFAFPHEDRDL